MSPGYSAKLPATFLGYATAALLTFLGVLFPPSIAAQAAATATILSSSSNPALVGAQVTFTATVIGSGPTGSVTFMDGATTLGGVELSGDRATLATSALAEGQQAITAVYGGDGANAPSTSFVLHQIVSPYSGVIAVAAGGGHTVALKSDGSVVAWGYNWSGQTTIPAVASSGVVAVAAGYHHTVALKSDGSVVAWGSNSSGQTTIPGSASSGVIAVAAGDRHTVALKGDGSVIAWGANDYDQTTVPAAAAAGVVAVAAGYHHTVALKSDGSVIAWGGNWSGQTTIPAAASSGVVAVAAGYSHTVALKSDGSVIAWGSNGSGQTTVPTAAASGVVAVAAGYHHTVALKSDGSVIAWDSNGSGQTTVPETAALGVVAVAAGYHHTVALKSDGSVIAWGDNSWGQTTVPLHSVTVTPAGSVSSGESVVFTGNAGGIDCTWDGMTPAGTCVSTGIIATTRVVLTAALPQNTFVDTWGEGCDSVTGTTCTIESLVADVTISPVTAAGTVVPPDAPVIGAATAGDAMASVSFEPSPSTGGGTIWWYTATSSGGQSASGNSSPISVSELTNGTAYTFTVTATNAAGTGPASGESNSVVPQQGTSTILSSSSNPALVGAPVTFTAMVLGSGSTGSVTFLDGAETLGNASLSGSRATFTTSALAEGQHAITAVYEGDAASIGSTSFALNQSVNRRPAIIAVAAGEAHTAALRNEGSVVVWGNNYYGQASVPLAATSGVIAIAAGRGHTVALKNDGSVVAWGSNGAGQTTVPETANSGVVAVSAGSDHTVALKNDGSVIAWGAHWDGQVTVPDAANSGVIAVAAGRYHTVALKNDGSVIAWGRYGDDQTSVPATVPPVAGSGVVAVASGYAHVVAPKSDGSVIAWGDDDFGQSTVPASATSGVIAVAAGERHSVALKSDGSVIAWGSDEWGQATIPDAATSGVIAVAAGAYHTVALKNDGSVVAWGNDSAHQSSVPWYTVSIEPSGPVPAGAMVRFAAEADGIDCAWDGVAVTGACSSPARIKTTRVVITADLPAGTFIDSWGDGCETVTPTACTIESLQGDTTISPVTATGTVAAPGPPVIGSATAGDSSASVTFSPPPSSGGGTIWWYTVTSSDGHHATGTSSPITVTGLTNFVPCTFTVTATNNAGTGPASEASNSVTPVPHTTILTSSSNPALLGAPLTFTATVLGSSPTGTVTFKDGETVVGTASLMAGKASWTTATLTAGLHSMTAVYGGDTGNSASVSNTILQGVTSSSGIVAIAAGSGHTVALKSDGAPVAWGSNTYGQTTIPSTTTGGVAAVSAGGSDTVVLKTDGSVVAWGYNGSGQTTVPAAATSGVVAVAAGGNHTVALKSDGSVMAWGLDVYGQTAVPAVAASGVVAVAAGAFHTVALKSDGSVISWGSGQTVVPAAVTYGVIAIAAGSDHSVALKNDGSVIAWGDNSYGQTTIPPEAMTGVIAVAAGGQHTVALKVDGSVLEWGLGAGVPNATLTVAPSGPVAGGQAVTFTADAGGIECTWDGATVSGACTSAGIIATTRVVLTASLPSNGYVASWGSGCDATTAMTCTIESLTADTTLSPVVDTVYGLVVGVAPGAGGTVTAEGIDCPGTCSGSFPGPSPIAHLVATPAPGYAFLRWEGDASGTSPSIDLPMAGDQRVTAIFSTSLSVCPAGCDFADLQGAVDAARAGDIVALAPGRWHVNLVVSDGKELTLRGSGATPGATILDGNTDAAHPGGEGSVVSVLAPDGIRTRVRIENLTVSGGTAPCGGGLQLAASGTGDLQVALSQVVVRLNAAPGGLGGGICARATGGGTLGLNVENALLTENAAGQGGGLFSSAEDDGSALHIGLMHATVGGNKTGGGAVLSASLNGELSGSVVSSILAGNKTVTARDLAVEATEGGTAAVDASFSDIISRSVAPGSLLWGTGMRTAGPVFRNPANGDFHLNADSPCIDRGTAVGAPDRDYEGTGRPQGAGVDIGADEYRPVVFRKLNLLSLLGGERIFGGRPYDITWGAPATLTLFKIYVSSNHGRTWTLKATRRGRIRHFTWTPPRVAKTSGGYRVKVEAYRNDVLAAAVQSVRNFVVLR